ncbi:Cyanophycin synthetase [Pseudidiomarina piscicola]|uniref:Cyanophycin synthetase n=1 Tax=Pseudidiomarina piscicola TaxID=2614830 RepID=A0A6S6WNX1_9GAMM|nr:cyanophycin synthetase [Pseudidiomarina piscicola]CAB0151194.1 Cyanophycin synthetase [Pseudidiomarina piscicola]VZT40700.1 Cyanophycin synthetase [Pseudomonas aeruginosa]
MNNSAQYLQAGPFHYFPGYLKQRRQPCMMVTMQPTAKLKEATQTPKVLAFFKWWMTELYADSNTTATPDELQHWPALAQHIAEATRALLTYLGFPLLDASSIEPPPRGAQAPWTKVPLPIPHCEPSLVVDAWQLTVASLNHALQTGKHDTHRLQQQLEKLKEASRFSVSPLLLNAAYQLDLPVTPLHGMLTQFGQGVKASWLEHTSTEHTPSLAVRTARDKQAAAIRLRQAGLPTAPHHEVTNQQDALQAAQALGYPVVVKPLNLDGGVGVAANLQNPQEVTAAYAIAHKHSPRVLLEKHVIGHDFRLTVLDNAMVWAVQRVPAGVTGDGTQTIEQLIAEENQTDQRRPGIQQTLQPLTVNSEATQLLQSQGHKLTAVPAKGQFITLRRTANVANGGRPVVVTAQVHPDNVTLATRAAQALRLDLAGVDLIIPDISRSWREPNNRGVICEVNAQPDLGSTTAGHLYPLLLQKRVQGNGRIPVVVIAGDASSTVFDDVCRELRTEGAEHIGWCRPSQAGINEETLSTARSLFANAMMLLTTPTVDALVLNITDDEPLKRGLPCDRIDRVILSEHHQNLHPLVRDMLKV